MSDPGLPLTTGEGNTAQNPDCDFIRRGDFNDCAHAGGGRGAKDGWCASCVGRLRDALNTLRGAWNAHFETCPAPMLNVPAPTMEQINEWANAPSDTASAGAKPQWGQPYTDALQAEVARLREQLDAARQALERIADQQPRTLANLRSHDVVFDGPLGADPSNWQDVAFTIYTDLCEVDSLARAALGVEGPSAVREQEA